VPNTPIPIGLKTAITASIAHIIGSASLFDLSLKKVRDQLSVEFGDAIVREHKEEIRGLVLEQTQIAQQQQQVGLGLPQQQHQQQQYELQQLQQQQQMQMQQLAIQQRQQQLQQQQLQQQQQQHVQQLPNLPQPDMEMPIPHQS